VIDMTTQYMNTLSQADTSTVACAAGARGLDGEHRQHLAVQVLAGTQPVTELAKRHGVSRKFVYHQADKGA
jgi:hypothetical protein